MRLLDAFCGAGGCSVGYYRAGFTDIVGVDVNHQKRYPFDFVQGDAIGYIHAHGHEFDMIHTSPPCQVYSVTKHLSNGTHPDLVDETRAALEWVGKPYVIENVPGASLINAPLLLCGSMFDLALIRHRYFENNKGIWIPPRPCSCQSLFCNSGPGDYSSFANGATAISDGRIAMGIGWMTGKELSQAIPPAYTEYVGRKMIELIGPQI